MHSLLELLEVSAYVPTAGYSLDLAKMAKAGLSRSEALARWVAKGRTEPSFYKAYKVLKDDLLRSAFKKTTDLSDKRIAIREKYAVVNQSLIAGKKKAAVSLAIELVEAAKKAGFTDMVVNLAMLLEGHFGAIETDTRRYLRYRKIRKEYWKLLEDEMDVKALEAELVFSLNKGKGISELEEKLTRLVGKNKGSLNFMRYRFTVLAVWFEQKKDWVGLIDLAKETLKFYGSCGADVPGVAVAIVYRQLVPLLSAEGRFAEAEAEISRGLQVNLAGSQNWHLLMLQKACVGLQSGKLPIAQAALKLAKEAPREHDNPDIDRRWGIVEAILQGKGVKDI